MIDQSTIQNLTNTCSRCNLNNQPRMCSDCYNRYQEKINQYIKMIYNNTCELQGRITDLIKNNKAISDKKIEQEIDKRINNDNIEKLSMYNKEIESQNQKINELLDIINNKKNILKSLKERNNSSPIFCNKSDKKNEIELSLQKYSNLKKSFIRKLFKQFVVNTNSLIIIDEFFEKNSETPEGMVLITNLDNIPGFKEDFNHISDDICPFKIKPSILLNKYHILKLNQFISSFVKFLIISSKKLNVHLPHSLMSIQIQSNKNGRAYKLNIEPNIKKINDENHINEIMIAYYLININYKILLENVFGEERVNKNKEHFWFDYSYFIDENKLMKKATIKNETINNTDCYSIETLHGCKIWVEKQTGLIIRDINVDYITDYNYEFNNVKDENVVKPDISDCQIE